MRARFWGTRGSMPVALTAADVRDKLAQALVAADGRRFESFGAAYDFAQRDLPFALTHTFGGHSSCVELETGSNEYFVCDMGSGARPFGAHVLARQGGRPATVNVFMKYSLLPVSSSDRKSTRLNSSHDQISYAVFC